MINQTVNLVPHSKYNITKRAYLVEDLGLLTF